MVAMTNEKPILNVLKNKQLNRGKVPWWMMRQAGRYLPEYREIRSQAGNFLDLVYNSDLACEVTLQPLRRYKMDAAILFSDILVIPHALGQEVNFVQGEGPKLGELNISKLGYAKYQQTLSPIYETVSKIKSGMMQEGFDQTALIGFCGAPWTVACYMIEGGGSKTFEKAKTMAYQESEEFHELIDLLVEASTQYLLEQIRAGAEVIQIFDSWAGLLDEDGFRKFVIRPTKQIIQTIKSEYPDIPVIGFPKGAASMYLPYVQETMVDGVSIDASVSTNWAARVIQPHCVVQGNLDPVRLLAAGDPLVMCVEKILSDLDQGPFIFNLGHGIIKDTDPENIAFLKSLLYS